MLPRTKKLVLLLSLLPLSILHADSKSDMLLKLQKTNLATFPHENLFTYFTVKQAIVPPADFFWKWNEVIIALDKYINKESKDLLGRKDDRIMAVEELVIKTNGIIISNLEQAIAYARNKNLPAAQQNINTIARSEQRKVLHNTIPGLRDLKKRVTLTNKKNAIDVLIEVVTMLDLLSNRIINSFDQFKIKTR